MVDKIILDALRQELKEWQDIRKKEGQSVSVARRNFTSGCIVATKLSVEIVETIIKNAGKKLD